MLLFGVKNHWRRIKKKKKQSVNQSVNQAEKQAGNQAGKFLIFFWAGSGKFLALLDPQSTDCYF